MNGRAELRRMKGKRMSRKTVRFVKGHGKYNKDDVAGFEAETARQLTEGKGAVAEMMGDCVSREQTQTLTIDVSDTARAELEKVQTQIAEAQDDLATREQQLQEGRDALAERERDLAAREKALADAEKAAAGEDAQPGAAPAQGKKTQGKSK